MYNKGTPPATTEGDTTMTNRMLGTCGQPPCGKCCGWKTKADNQSNKRRFRRIERREAARVIFEEVGA